MTDVLDRYARLYSSLVSDCVEEAGLGPRCAQAGLEPYGSDGLRVVVGWAFPAQVRKTSMRVEIDRLLQMVQHTPADSVVVDDDLGLERVVVAGEVRVAA